MVETMEPTKKNKYLAIFNGLIIALILIMVILEVLKIRESGSNTQSVLLIVIGIGWIILNIKRWWLK